MYKLQILLLNYLYFQKFEDFSVLKKKIYNY
jgi:hypothetical protein